MDFWRESVQRSLEAIAGDDLSLALVGLGWNSFQELKADYSQRCRVVSDEFIKPIDELNDMIGELADRHKESVAKRDQLRLDLWNRYKGRYELFNQPERDGD